MGKRGGNKKDPIETAVEALGALGLEEETARQLVGKVGEYKKVVTETAVEESPSGDGSFRERLPPDAFVYSDEARTNLVNWLCNVTLERDGLERMIETSEIPSPMLMDLVMTKALDQINTLGFEGSPYDVFLFNFAVLMKALNRKARKEGIQIYKSSAEALREEFSEKGRLIL